MYASWPGFVWHGSCGLNVSKPTHYQMLSEVNFSFYCTVIWNDNCRIPFLIAVGRHLLHPHLCSLMSACQRNTMKDYVERIIGECLHHCLVQAWGTLYSITQRNASHRTFSLNNQIKICGVSFSISVRWAISHSSNDMTSSKASTKNEKWTTSYWRVQLCRMNNHSPCLCWGTAWRGWSGTQEWSHVKPNQEDSDGITPNRQTSRGDEQRV